MALLMLLDKSPSVSYASRSLGGGGDYSNIRVLPDYFLLKWIIFKVREHEYMNKCSYPIIDLCTALISFTANSLDSGAKTIRLNKVYIKNSCKIWKL